MRGRNSRAIERCKEHWKTVGNLDCADDPALMRDHSISFAVNDSEQALELLAELTRRWQTAISEVTAT